MARASSLLATAAVALLTTGCYTLQPVAGAAPDSGADVAFDVTDAGRVALGGAMGPSIGRIAGRVVRRADDGVVVAVSSVDYLAGGGQTWRGEPVTLRPEYIGTTYVRRFSKSRTIALGAVVVGGIAFIASRSIIGGGTNDEPSPGPKDPTGSTQRGPRP